ERLALAEGRHALELREATARARAEARDALLKQVVHDLATDLSNIAVAADLARQSPGDAQAWGSLDASLDRIDRFLAEKRAQLEEDAPRRASRLAVGVEATRTVLAAVVEAKGQRCHFEVADPQAVVPLSEIELVQVLVNVVGNAVKFTPAGGTISCVAAPAGAWVSVVVADDGPGIPEGLLDRLGDGRRADASGSGLGLQNARRLVEDAGGTLAWRNGDPGAVVEILLPLDPAALPAQ
ncbi:MAG: sensor histidine kinase, partial [Cyanobacteria bacterium RYN_339]|nr:sensor histidine kinase [Cyanobacteria bacterium RYN_339]